MLPQQHERKGNRGSLLQLVLAAVLQMQKGHMLGGPPVDLLAVLQRHLFQGERHCEDAAGGGAAHQVKELVDAAAGSLLQLPQLPDDGNALSVSQSVSQSVGRSVGRSVGYTFQAT